MDTDAKWLFIAMAVILSAFALAAAVESYADAQVEIAKARAGCVQEATR